MTVKFLEHAAIAIDLGIVRAAYNIKPENVDPNTLSTLILELKVRGQIQDHYLM